MTILLRLLLLFNPQPWDPNTGSQGWGLLTRIPYEAVQITHPPDPSSQGWGLIPYPESLMRQFKSPISRSPSSWDTPYWVPHLGPHIP